MPHDANDVVASGRQRSSQYQTSHATNSVRNLQPVGANILMFPFAQYQPTLDSNTGFNSSPAETLWHRDENDPSIGPSTKYVTSNVHSMAKHSYQSLVKIGSPHDPSIEEVKVPVADHKGNTNEGRYE